MPKGSKCNEEKPDKEEESTHIEDDNDRIQEAICCLRSLVSKEKDLKVRTDDVFLLRYLRATDFKPKEAFDRMVQFYKFKTKYPEYFVTSTLADHKHLMAQNFSLLLPGCDQNGRRVLWFRLGCVDTSTVYYSECNKMTDIWEELILDEEETQKNGLAVLVDLGGFSWRLLRYCTPTVTYTSTLKEELRPWKNRQVHVVNTSWLMNGLMAIVYPLLSESMKQRIHFHGRDWASLHKYINPEILPQEYGGHLAEDDTTKMYKYLYENEEKLNELFSLGYATH